MSLTLIQERIDSNGSLMCQWPGNVWKHATSGGEEPYEPPPSYSSSENKKFDESHRTLATFLCKSRKNVRLVAKVPV